MLQNVHSSECNNVIMPKISVYQKFKIILKKLVRANFPKRGFKFELNVTESNYNNLIFNRIIIILLNIRLLGPSGVQYGL